MAIKTDTQFEEVTLVKVEREGGWWNVTRSDGFSFGFEDPGFEPKVGDVARFYGKGIGYSVRGLTLNGRVVFYRTAEEEEQRHREWVAEQRRKREQEFEAQRAERDARYSALPPEFRARIDRFRAGNPDFRVEHEPYELFCCEQAVVIASSMKDADAIPAFVKLSWEQQKQIVPGLDDGHSGNTFGMACRLAHWYLTRPENVAREHGALVPLVGCKDYGCTHDDPAAREE